MLLHCHRGFSDNPFVVHWYNYINFKYIIDVNDKINDKINDKYNGSTEAHGVQQGTTYLRSHNIYGDENLLMYRIIASVLCHDSLQPHSAIRSLLPTLSRFQLQLRMDVPLRHLEFLALVLVFSRSHPPRPEMV
jgi:hypothetical protein